MFLEAVMDLLSSWSRFSHWEYPHSPFAVWVPNGSQMPISRNTTLRIMTFSCQPWVLFTLSLSVALSHPWPPLMMPCPLPLAIMYFLPHLSYIPVPNSASSLTTKYYTSSPSMIPSSNSPMPCPTPPQPMAICLTDMQVETECPLPQCMCSSGAVRAPKLPSGPGEANLLLGPLPCWTFLSHYICFSPSFKSIHSPW